MSSRTPQRYADRDIRCCPSRYRPRCPHAHRFSSTSGFPEGALEISEVYTARMPENHPSRAADRGSWASRSASDRGTTSRVAPVSTRSSASSLRPVGPVRRPLTRNSPIARLYAERREPRNCRRHDTRRARAPATSEVQEAIRAFVFPSTPIGSSGWRNWRGAPCGRLPAVNSNSRFSSNATAPIQDWTSSMSMSIRRSGKSATQWRRSSRNSPPPRWRYCMYLTSQRYVL